MLKIRIAIPFAGLALTACGQSEAGRPNVIYVFPDQYRNSSLGFWSDPEFDTLVQQAISEMDPVKQAELTAQAEQIFLNDAAILPIYENGVTSAVQSYVEGPTLPAL